MFLFAISVFVQSPILNFTNLCYKLIITGAKNLDKFQPIRTPFPITPIVNFALQKLIDKQIEATDVVISQGTSRLVEAIVTHTAVFGISKDKDTFEFLSENILGGCLHG